MIIRWTFGRIQKVNSGVQLQIMNELMHYLRYKYDNNLKNLVVGIGWRERYSSGPSGVVERLQLDTMAIEAVHLMDHPELTWNHFFFSFFFFVLFFFIFFFFAFFFFFFSFFFLFNLWPFRHFFCLRSLSPIRTALKWFQSEAQRISKRNLNPKKLINEPENMTRPRITRERKQTHHIFG